ncbi:cob(I)yrinic acid a,c-diamide adenosyltransferase [Corynebacterium mendelii]|uniref:Cob(I)yrinic acid a,c-diamide adenosyltransferase n=1 Tax=Corynebacterium mendelii TaxID=2765362 RepID=A0A939IX34_9CORY|nr:cob(I)yrinic acid a,c-diamide adenosyltransferase [Corynebacterium mendelii]MBN9643252.1 cob(I)yrinic acid a,c-diamide adenosyltransferase [Corynebacterium mendelii]
MAHGRIDPDSIPDDGLSTRERRQLPVTAVHTGEGKGKTTAAMGMALRAWNAGLDICVFQFVKSDKWHAGEEDVFATLKKIHDTTGQGGDVEWHKMGQGWSWSWRKGTEDQHAAAATAGWEEVKRRLAAEQHDFYLLDEFTYPVTWGWIDAREVADVLAHRPGTQHVVITGRNADPAIVEVSDLVTEMTKIKHPFDQGRKGQKGIEW